MYSSRVCFGNFLKLHTLSCNLEERKCASFTKIVRADFLVRFFLNAIISFEGIINKITVCKKLKSFTEGISKNYQRILKLALFKIALLPWQRGFLTTFFIFRISIL